MTRKELAIYLVGLLLACGLIWMGSSPISSPATETVVAPQLSPAPALAIDEAQAEADREPWEDEPGGDALPYGASASRGNAWAKARDAYRKTHPTCAACGCDKNIAIHHVKAWHLCEAEEDQWMRTDPANLVALCTCDGVGSDGSGKHQCHWHFGHLAMNWKASNPNVRADAERFRQARIEAAHQLELEKNPDASDPRNCE